MIKKALITGITGQDGSYLAEYLLELGYEVHGTVRRVALEDQSHRLERLQSFKDKLILHSASIESYPCLFKLFSEIKPHECYHLAAQSFVSYSFEDEYSTMNTNVNGTHYVLSSLKHANPECRFYFAASSEMFGKVAETPQKETTRFHPRSIYGISKVVGFDLTRNYREAYDLYACSGILFNHESPRRGYEFVTRKISSTAAKIKLGLADELRLGNLEAKRDWGYAKDYVRAMHAMLNRNEPKDYVVGTGETHTVKEFLNIAFGELDLNPDDYVKIDPLFYRPSEVELLLADPSMAKQELDWRPTISFQELVSKMVKSDYNRLKSQI